MARALAVELDVLIADEPTSSIDHSARAQLLNLILEVRSTLGLTLIPISHDLAVVRHLGDRTYVMLKGEIVEHGPSETIFQNPKTEYTRRLVSASQE